MQQQDFNEMLEERIRKIRETLEKKGDEYGTSDRLHNFKVAGQIGNTSPQAALWGMSMKHLVSITDMIKGHLENNRGNVDEKIGDMINYLILLEALFEDLR